MHEEQLIHASFLRHDPAPSSRAPMPPLPPVY
jgi:hypothetical protein